MAKIKETIDSLKCGDTVRLRTNANKIEVLDFHSQPYYFDSQDVGTVTHLNSPCLRYRKALPDTQIVVRFFKKSVTNYLVVRVDNADLELCKAG